MKTRLFFRLFLSSSVFLILLTFFVISCTKNEKNAALIPVKVASGLEFPEGPAWDGTGTLYVSDCYGAWIGRYRDGKLDTLVSKKETQSNFENSNGLTINQNGNLYACDFGLGAILEITPQGQIQVFLDGYEGQPFNRPNDLAFDPRGNLYFTDPNSYGADKKDGTIYAYFRDRDELLPVYEGLAFPNGIAFSADTAFLYVCESALNRILKFPLRADGGLEPYQVFAELPGGDPDGIAFDTAGNLYVAHFGSGSVYMLDTSGTIVQTIHMPGKKPTNVEFGGEDRRTLFITEVETGALYTVRVEIPGLRLFSAPLDQED